MQHETAGDAAAPAFAGAAPASSSGVSRLDVPPLQPARRVLAGYVVRHWRGELPLPAAWWINGVLATSLLPVLQAAVLAPLEDGGAPSLRVLASANLALAALCFAVQAWSATGIVRAAAHHVERGGRRLWARLSVAVLALTMLGLALEAVRLDLPARYAELLRLAAGRDPIPPVTVQVADAGRALLILGELGAGSIDRVRTALDAAPHVRVVHLSSPGGRVFEARGIAQEIRRRALDTYVDGRCDSACTLMFLAGRERGASPASRLGFHRASFAGVQDATENRALLDAYRASGLPESFLARVDATASSDMWYPTPQELVEAGVVTRLSLGDEGLALTVAGIASQADLESALRHAAAWRHVDERFPGTVAQAASAGWQAMQRGGTDAQALSAMRATLATRVPQALKTAPDEILDRFGRLGVRELAQAQALGPQACNALLDGRLDTLAALPRATVDEELALLADLFAAPPRTDPPPSPAAALAALRAPYATLPPDDRSVADAPARYRDQPGLRCNALLAFQQAIAALPGPARLDALRALYQR